MDLLFPMAYSQKASLFTQLDYQEYFYLRFLKPCCKNDADEKCMLKGAHVNAV